MKDFLTQDHSCHFGATETLSGFPQQTGVALANEEVCAERAREGLRLVQLGEEKTMEGWVVYGAALNDGRRLFPSDNQFHDWMVDRQLVGPNDHDRAAAMWAAANSADFTATKEAHDRVRTVRGLHAKWKAAQQVQPEVLEDQEPITPKDLRKYQSLEAKAECPASTPAEKQSAHAQATKLREKFGPGVATPTPSVKIAATTNELTKVALAKADNPEVFKLVSFALRKAYGHDEENVQRILNIFKKL